MTGRFWTTREMAILREHYPVGGMDACLAYLERPRSTIYQKALALGLHAPGYCGYRERHEVDAEMDMALRRLHETPLLKGAIVAFAEQWKRPTWWISKRARELGLKTPRFKELPWTDAEIQILHDTAHITTANARKRLMAAGFNRSETAIHVKRKREGISVKQAKQDAGIYNENQCAELLGVDRKTVGKWAREGELKATFDGVFYNVRESDLRRFIVTYPHRVALRKIPDSSRVWFIELVAGPLAFVSADAA